MSSSDACMRFIRQAARALYNETYPTGLSHLCRLPTQIPMKWWPRDTLRAGEVIHILGKLYIRESVFFLSVLCFVTGVSIRQPMLNVLC